MHKISFLQRPNNLQSITKHSTKQSETLSYTTKEPPKQYQTLPINRRSIQTPPNNLPSNTKHYQTTEEAFKHQHTTFQEIPNTTKESEKHSNTTIQTCEHKQTLLDFQAIKNIQLPPSNLLSIIKKSESFSNTTKQLSYIFYTVLNFCYLWVFFLQVLAILLDMSKKCYTIVKANLRGNKSPVTFAYSEIYNIELKYFEIRHPPTNHICTNQWTDKIIR